MTDIVVQSASNAADLGLRGSPNFEMLRLAHPDLIVSSGWFTWVQDSLEQIAPVASYSVYESGRPPYAPAEQVTLALGGDLGRRLRGRWSFDRRLFQ